MNSGISNTGRPIEISVREVSALLAERMRSVCDGLGLSGHVVQGALLPLNPTRNDRTPGSFVIQLEGSKRGRWDEYATGDYGDAIDLVAYVQFGRVDRTSKAEAMRWAKRFLGLGEARHMDPAHAAKLKKARAAMDEANAKAEAMALHNRDKDRRRAQALFLEAKELAPGLPGWTYLTEARGLPLDQLARLPWAVRSHHGLRHVETDRTVPCLISALLFPDGSFGAIHRVFLEPDGRSKIIVPRKEVPQKKIWPSGWHGASIPISRGASGMAPKAAAAAGIADECAFAEGVEDAFTVALLNPDWRVSAVGTGGNFASVELPVSAAKVIVIRDRDPNRKTRAGVTKKVDQLRARCEADGLAFFESWPQRGFKDFNDMIRGVRA